MLTKVCNKCKRELPLVQFHSDPGKPLGVSSQCRDCQREYRHLNKAKLLPRAYARRANNPDYDFKRKAWNALYYALRTGKIVKPAQCSICKAQVGVEHIRAHHEDYNRPFEVIWCCSDCHVLLDRLRRENEVHRDRA